VKDQSEKGKPMKTTEKNLDDLTVISGIGPVRQQLMRDLLDIFTFEDLAKRPADQIVLHFKEKGQIVSRETVVSWQEKAKEMSEFSKQSAQPATDINEENDIPQKKLVREDGWKPFASFVIEFQSRDKDNRGVERRTMVHYMEEDIGTLWQGVESRKLCSWILEQMDLPEDLTQGDQDTLSKQEQVHKSVKKPARILVNDIRLFQPPNANKPSGFLEDRKAFTGSVKGNLPFNLEVSFEISGEHADEVIKRGVAGFVQSYAYEEGGSGPIHLADGTIPNLKKGKYTYNLTLPETKLKSGTYRFWVMVGLDNGHTVPNYVEVPTLTIQ
jgi:hypothetical protein